MRGLLVGVSVLPSSPQQANPKENHTEISISYKTDWPISSSFLFVLVTYINPLVWSILATWLGTFLSCADYLLLPRCSAQDCKESASSFPEFSCSHCNTSTSCLVFPPILSAWQISIFLKHDWQNTDNSPVPLPPLLLKKKKKENIHSPFLGGMWT